MFYVLEVKLYNSPGSDPDFNSIESEYIFREE
jgi:hypothetical protein